ncbi:MAG: hypothetical protein KDA27_01045 [Candidatus Eisenbacteria bacterium]|uniref:DUF4149 domain-containing protein n=1 Tax=Eiseniibacteriota bacterium TaxID=2212470 RepID=A0A956N824_UNCEI|nr:hypothetical protein [Candidatus Eisenbacteria bacterium]
MNIKKFEPPRLVSLPKTRRLSWIPTALEFTQQVVLGSWMGGILVFGVLAVPQLRLVVDDARDAAWAALELSMQLNFVSAGAGSFLLLVTLMMYLLALREQRATFVQIAVILGMTGAAVASHVAVGPRIADILREHPDLALLAPDLRTTLDALGAWNAALMTVQFVLGCVALAPGVRRWYRYVSPNESGDEPFLIAADGE